MKRILEINKCSECKYVRLEGYRNFCKKKNRVIYSYINLFPDFCPLPIVKGARHDD